ncbi:MAG: RNA 3'-terminal phosphate cyclase [Nitrospiraceae bacterium]|nr:MAG: RNA 3'-terminal phosphate cyclase [Nitrospiraceae bacterium]
MKAIKLDGSFGEGGGQILRTALSLSCVTGQAFSLFNIRKGRERPGLMPQHCTCANAAAAISSARMSGNEKGSTDLSFTPGRVSAGSYLFDIGTAGSSSLVLQTLLPPLIFAGDPSRLTIRGGTHVPWSPPFDYIEGVFLPMLRKIGVEVEASINRYGFYPRGGGEVAYAIHPPGKLHSLNLKKKGPLLAIKGRSAVARLPLSIAERQRKAAFEELAPLAADIEVVEVPAAGPGTFVFLKGQYEHIRAGFSSLGMRGKPAEKVGREASRQFRAFHASPACLDQHLADQILLYLALAGAESSFTVSRITGHLMTNLWVIEQFLTIQYRVEGDSGSEGRVVIRPQ